tara:strand:+ start:209 stop:634 length:426 start_codon:yes stop_codon:yes gene_type:complete
MSKVIKLTEKELVNIINKVLKEDEKKLSYPFSSNPVSPRKRKPVDTKEGNPTSNQGDMFEVDAEPEDPSNSKEAKAYKQYDKHFRDFLKDHNFDIVGFKKSHGSQKGKFNSEYTLTNKKGDFTLKAKLDFKSGIASGGKNA